MLRFHLDESIPFAVAVGLRSRGIDVTTSVDAELRGSSDSAQLQFAQSEARVIVSHDVDFLRLAQSGIEHAGICYCHQLKYGIGQLVLKLVALSRTFTPEEMRNTVHFL